MTLIEYIVENGGTGTLQCEFLTRLAFKAECSPNTLYMIAKGHKKAGPTLARRIEAASQGHVSRNELRPDIFGSPVINDVPPETEAA